MKCFVLGFVGVIVGGVLFLIGYAQYCDYVVEAQLDIWCLQLGAKAAEIEQLAMDEGALDAVSKKISPQPFTEESKVREHMILDTGAVFVQGGRENQILLLTPSVTDNGVQWEVFAGSTQRPPHTCRKLAQNSGQP